MSDKWYYNSSSGSVGKWNTITMYPALHTGIGWHGPFDTQADAFAYYANGHTKNPGWKAPTTDLGTAAQQEVSTTASQVTGGKWGLSDSEIKTWLLRIGEILLGMILVGVGVAKLTGTTNAVATFAKAKI
jgi:hypothetical protein